MDSNGIIEFYSEAQPRMTWEISECELGYIRTLKDGQGTNLWTAEPNYNHMPGRLVGIPIAISKDKCFQLRFDFSDGHTHVLKYNMGDIL
jgi:HK97 family phage major capsid protein